MRRRDLIAMLGGASVAGLPLVRMRAADKRVLIGFLSNGTETGNPVYAWFLDGVREAGHVERRLNVHACKCRGPARCPATPSADRQQRLHWMAGRPRRAAVASVA